jgi:hypothetical protein
VNTLLLVTRRESSGKKTNISREIERERRACVCVRECVNRYV